MPAQRSFTVQAKAGERRRAATQEELLAATKRLLAAGAPLAALSVEKIVAEAGVVRTTFYHHFRDKYELLERLASEQQSWLEETGRTVVRDPDLSRETIGRTIDEIVSHWTENHAVIAAIIELAEYDQRMADAWHHTIDSVATVAAEIFAPHWASHGNAPRHPERVAEVLTWMIERSCDQIARDPSTRESVADSLAEVIWRVLHPERTPAVFVKR
jgi:AcrR family transcriptional regulator